MVLLCTMLDPVTINNVCIFHDKEACGTIRNQFFKIDANRFIIAATRSVMVGNVQVAIKEFMCHKMEWIEENYIKPLTQMIDKIERENRQPQRQLLSTKWASIPFTTRATFSSKLYSQVYKKIGAAAAVVFCKIYVKTIYHQRSKEMILYFFFKHSDLK